MNATFHISLPCKNIEATKKFYTEELGFSIGRSTSNWLDVNLFENQLTFVLADSFDFKYLYYSLEKEAIPSFHFGVVLENEEWDNMYNRINPWSTDDIVKRTFFEDKQGEQSSFFVKDPNDYFIEFKTFKKYNEIFM